MRRRCETGPVRPVGRGDSACHIFILLGGPVSPSNRAYGPSFTTAPGKGQELFPVMGAETVETVSQILQRPCPNYEQLIPHGYPGGLGTTGPAAGFLSQLIISHEI